MTQLVLGPLLDQPLNPAEWMRFGKDRPTRASGDPRWDDYRVTNTFDGPDKVNGGKHQATDVGNTQVGYVILAPADCMVRPRRHFDGALGLDLDLGHGVVLSVWHLSWLAFYVPTVQGKSTEGAWYSVKRGEVIGKTGNTGAKLLDGSPMPAHTHIELERDGVRVDPEPHLFGAPIVIEEDDVKIPSGRYLVRGTVGTGNRLRRDPKTTEGSKILGTDIGDAGKAYVVQVYQRSVAGEPYELGGKPGSGYTWVGVFGESWFVADPLVTDLAVVSDELPPPDCSAERNKIMGARTAVSGARQAIEAAEALLA